MKPSQRVTSKRPTARAKSPAARRAAGQSKPGKPIRRSLKTAIRRRILPARPVPPPPPPKKPPSPGTLAAVKAFELALRQFNRHDFSGARQAFELILSKFGEEAEVTSRARTYVNICEQRLARTPSIPRNADALYDQGVFELNRGSVREAIALFEKALKADQRADHVLYSLAASFARLNELGKAMEALRRAISLRQVHKSHARRDLDFITLRANEDFQQLIGFDFELVEE